MMPMKHKRFTLLARIFLLMCAIAGAVQANGQQAVTLYDDWFHAATCRILTTSTGDSLAYTLAVTFDEGQIKVPQGSALQLILKGGMRIELFTDREINKRKDISKRRYRNRTDVYITCHYPITRKQLEMLSQNEITRLRAATDNGWIERRITNRKAFQYINLP